MQQIHVIKTLQQLVELEAYINTKDFVAFDTETTGLDKDSKIIGFSVSADVDIGYYVILSYWDASQLKLLDTEVTFQHAASFMKLLTQKKLIMHNAVFDCMMVDNNFKVDLMPSLHTDTMILANLLDENRGAGLKDLGVTIYGENAKDEQKAMKESIVANGGEVTLKNYELYKADADLIAKYGAKDTILTLSLFYEFLPTLYEQKLEQFYYEDECMPLLRSTTYQLNKTGLKVDMDRLSKLRGELETNCMESKAFIYREIDKYVKDLYPATSKVKTFNIGSSKQLAWLIFEKLDNEFGTLTEEGKVVCKFLGLKLPYSFKAKRDFIQAVRANKGSVYKTSDKGRATKITDYWNYLQADKGTLAKIAHKYKWVEEFLAYNKNLKILNTYVIGIQERMRYGTIHPSFNQIGTKSGRYSSQNPNFQNLPRDDKRVKSCIVSRPGSVFVGADYSQLEARVFASISQDPALLECFESGKDFYSVVGIGMFDKYDCSPFKKDENAFATKYPQLRQIAKQFALATAYGTGAAKQAVVLGKSRDECQQLIDKYFMAYPSVELMMLKQYETVKKNGVVYGLYGKPRRIPAAKDIAKIYGNIEHSELPYEARNLLNLAVNHPIQSSAASIVNRAAIAFCKTIKDLGIENCNVILQIHDELVVECKEEDAEDVKVLLKHYMELTTQLPGVKLIAEPKIAKNLGDLK